MTTHAYISNKIPIKPCFRIKIFLIVSIQYNDNLILHQDVSVYPSNVQIILIENV